MAGGRASGAADKASARGTRGGSDGGNRDGPAHDGGRLDASPAGMPGRAATPRARGMGAAGVAWRVGAVVISTDAEPGKAGPFCVAAGHPPPNPANAPNLAGSAADGPGGGLAGLGALGRGCRPEPAFAVSSQEVGPPTTLEDTHRDGSVHFLLPLLLASA